MKANDVKIGRGLNVNDEKGRVVKVYDEKIRDSKVKRREKTRIESKMTRQDEV